MSHQVADWLIERGASSVVVACNTASAAALESLRLRFDRTPIVGMEPAVKPAAMHSTTGTVAVFATAATFQGQLYASVVDRFARDITVIRRACPEWVELVEAGIIDGPDAERLVSTAAAEAVSAGADQIVLGCTHFSFLAATIASVTGADVIDPAQAVAAQVERVVRDPGDGGSLTLAASGDIGRFQILAREIAGILGNVIPFAP